MKAYGHVQYPAVYSTEAHVDQTIDGIRALLEV